MGGPVIRYTDPAALKPENASVFDSYWTRIARLAADAARALGYDDPSAQVMSFATPLEIPTARAMKTLKELATPVVKKAIRAYHGSPHDFDKFALEKIGTGEGAQAYGHGLYFAEKEATAKSYREALAHGDQLVVRVPGKAPLAGNAIDDIGLNATKFLDIGRQQAGQFPHNTALYAKQAADRAAAGLPGAATRNTAVKARIDEWANAKIGYEPIKGKMYEVDIKADPETFLDWDKPLKDQSKSVRAAVGDLQSGELQLKHGGAVNIAGGGQIRAYHDPDFGMKYTLVSPDGTSTFRLSAGDVQNLLGTGVEGKSLYQILSSKMGSEAKATEFLKSKGVPGIKYLDQGSRPHLEAYNAELQKYRNLVEESRTKVKAEPNNQALRDELIKNRNELNRIERVGPGTRNYVVFDESLIDILRKYGFLPPIAGLGALSQVGQPPQQEALMPSYPGFIGATDRVTARTVNAERTINWYPEIATGTPKARSWLAPTPGLDPFVVLGAGPVRALYSEEGRCFAVGGTNFFEILEDATFVNRGTVGQDDHAASISSNGSDGHQLFIVSAGDGFIFNLETNLFTPITAADFPDPCAMGAFLDGYFLALKTDTDQFQISSLEDGLLWDPLDVALVSQTTGIVRAMVPVHRELWLLGTAMTTVWADIGDPDFPFAPIPGAFIEQGIGSRFGWTQIDNSLIWHGNSEAGGRVAYRAQGYTPQRISTHAVEQAWTAVSTMEDTVCWSYQDRGHAFACFYLPQAETTWVYDVATQAWHERALWDPAAVAWVPHLARCHTWCWERHLVGDRLSPAVYHLDAATYTDGVVTET